MSRVHEILDLGVGFLELFEWSSCGNLYSPSCWACDLLFKLLLAASDAVLRRYMLQAVIRTVMWSLKGRDIHGPFSSELERHDLLISLAATTVCDIRATLSRRVQILLVQRNLSLVDQCVVRNPFLDD